MSDILHSINSSLATTRLTYSSLYHRTRQPTYSLPIKGGTQIESDRIILVEESFTQYSQDFQEMMDKTPTRCDEAKCSIINYISDVKAHKADRIIGPISIRTKRIDVHHNCIDTHQDCTTRCAIVSKSYSEGGNTYRISRTENRQIVIEVILDDQGPLCALRPRLYEDDSNLRPHRKKTRFT